MTHIIKYAVLTSSDSGAAGQRTDIGGDAIVETMSSRGHINVVRTLVADDIATLTAQLRKWSEQPEIELILTTGGTGLSPRDVMPEATMGVIDYQVPGMAEAMRLESLKITPMAMLSRAVAGVANRTLIINLPGNPKGAVETLQVLLDVLPHAVEIMRGSHTGEHPIARKHHSAHS